MCPRCAAQTTLEGPFRSCNHSGMNDDLPFPDAGAIERIAAWLVERGLAGDGELALLQGFCERFVEAGSGLSRATLLIDTLHPIYEGRGFFWNRDEPVQTPVSHYGPGVTGTNQDQWLRSPFYHQLQTGGSELRRRLERGETEEFPVLEDLRAEGQTDYLALVLRLGEEARIGDMDCILTRWSTARPGGFDAAEVEALRRLVPFLGLAVKSRSLARIAESLVEAYLGRDPGRRVLQGRMSRGVVEKMNAVLWFSDMQGYTALSEDMVSDQVIHLLNDYAEAVIVAVQGAGGDVLKLIGDGVLAIFTAEDPADACCSALRAEADLRARLADLAARRAEAGEAISSVYIGLHIGDVFYGNIGSKDRLDFTVIGPAVNEASRIASLCSSINRDVLFSSDFHAALPQAEKKRLVSMGRFALRNVSRTQELFTLDSDA